MHTKTNLEALDEAFYRFNLGDLSECLFQLERAHPELKGLLLKIEKKYKESK